MIPRTLVPVNVRPVDKDEVKKRPNRVSTYICLLYTSPSPRDCS